MRKAYRRNLRASRRDDFVARMSAEIRRTAPRFIRYHVSGDFYSAEYIGKVLQLVRQHRDVTWFMYTRSWRVPELQEALKELVREPNCVIWLSTDSTSGPAPRWRGIAGIAYMAINEHDTPSSEADLVFFTQRPAVKTSFVAGALVCPFEQQKTPSKELTCTTCRYCTEKQPRFRWRHKKEKHRRLPLPVLVSSGVAA